MVKGYASRYRKKLASEDRSKTIEALKQGILEKARDDEHEGNLAWDYGFEQALKKEAYRQAVDIVDENEPEYLLSPEFFKTEFAEDVNLSFLSPERYYKPQPVTKAEKAERAKSQTRLERERLLAAVEEGRARRKRLNEAEKRRQERWKYEESLRQMPEPSAEPKPRRRMKRKTSISTIKVLSR
ncbi:plectin-like [Chiloscyllium plagiosum]|uniref:plectin-like n=1 Tax=Chiloscyllium plagiosum TaxID=36176 RepID=UPI001CB7D8C8|nr:plectin-like [Chiloscyllium plagiosum]